MKSSTFTETMEIHETLATDTALWHDDATAEDAMDVVDQILAEAEELRVAISGDLALSPAPNSTPKPKPTIKPKRSRNSTRDRRQTEAQFLRRHIAELDDELKRLKLRREGGNTVIVRPKGIVSAWQRLAQRQKTACTHSERENASLRRQVVQRAQQIQSIQELLYDTRTANAQGLSRALLSSKWDDGMIFAELKRQAVSAFEGAERAVKEHAVAIDSGDSNHVTREFDAVRSQLVAHLASTFVFPFDVHTTSVALWDALPSVYAGYETPGRVKRSDSVYAVTYVVQLETDAGPLSVRVHDLIMRFESKDTTSKSVIVWQTALDTSSRSAANVSPIVTCGWLVMQQQPDACRSTVLQSVFEFRSPSTGTSHSGLERNTVMEAWITLGKTCVENIVLQVDKKLMQ